MSNSYCLPSSFLVFSLSSSVLVFFYIMLHIWLACLLCLCFHLHLCGENLLNRNGPKSPLCLHKAEKCQLGIDSVDSVNPLFIHLWFFHWLLLCLWVFCVCLPVLTKKREYWVWHVLVIIALLSSGSQSTCLIIKARILFVSCFQNLLFQISFLESWVKIMHF